MKPQTWNTRSELRLDSYRSYTQIIEHCITHGKSLILGGDIFDSSKPDSQTVEIFRRGIDTMAGASLPVYVIQGQHDRSTPPWPIALDGSKIQYVHKQKFMPICDGPVFYGIDQTPVRAVLDAELERVPSDVDVLVLHQLAKPVFPLEGAYDFDPEVVPAHIKMLLIGDYHKKCEFQWHTNKMAYYPGSIHMCKIDENPVKSVLDLSIHPSGTGITVTDVPLITRPYTFWVINDDKDLEAAVQQAKAMPKADKKMLPVIVATYGINVPAVESTLREVLDEKAYLWIRPVSMRTVWSVEGKAADVQHKRMTLEGCASNFLNNATEEYELLLELLNNPNIEEVLTTWRIRKQV